MKKIVNEQKDGLMYVQAVIKDIIIVLIQNIKVAKKAQEKADINLVNSRRGIDITSEEFKQLDAIIKNGIDDNKSIYQIKIENNDTIKQCVSTLYGYINNGYLTTKKWIYLMLLLIKKESTIKSMSIPRTIKSTEQVILILIILLFYIRI